MRVFAAVVLAAACAACGGSKIPACQGVATTCVGFNEGTSESKIAEGFAKAQPGTTLSFGEGTFKFTNTLTLAAKGVTVQGVGIDKTVLDFGGQAAGSEGIHGAEGSDGTVLADFTVRNTKGDGIKVLGSIGVTFRRVKVQWTNPDGSTHGAYGVYPVQCKNVLIEDSVVIGAADAGIYVGQSDMIIVRNNRAEQNVAGIEIENSFNADVYGNTATDNTAGILVFDLPGLPQQGGHHVRVFNNTLKANNRLNFAAPGSTVSLVPAGTGFFVMANDRVEVFGNTIADNGTAAASVISYLITGLDITDGRYNPFPSNIDVHDNTMTNNGRNPDGHSIGTLLFLNRNAFKDAVIPAQLYDGILPPGSPATGNPQNICFKNNAGGFANLHLDKIDPKNPATLGQVLSQDATPYACSLDHLPAVSLP